MKADKNIFFPTGLIFSKRNLEDLTLSSNRCFCFECYIFSIAWLEDRWRIFSRPGKKDERVLNGEVWLRRVKVFDSKDKIFYQKEKKEGKRVKIEMEKYFHLLLFLCNILISSSVIPPSPSSFLEYLFFSLSLFTSIFRVSSFFYFQTNTHGDASICKLKEDTLRVHGVHVHCVDTCLETRFDNYA